jgi:hypothetical protein
MRGRSPHSPLVLASWRGAERSEEIEIDSLRMRTLQLLVNLLRSNRLPPSDGLKLLGEHLFVTLFGPTPSQYGPRSLFMQAVKELRVEGETRRRLMRVSLEIDPGVGDLGSWPWEYLYIPQEPHDPDTGFFLGRRTNFMLTRQLPLSVPEYLENISPPLRILFVVLSPTAVPLTASDTPAPLPLERIEYKAVLETLMALRDKQSLSRIELQVLTEREADDGTALPTDKLGNATRASFDAFVATVEDFDPHVVHIIGHGRYRHAESGTPSGELAFPNIDLAANWVSDEELSDALLGSSSLRLVFLQACESAETQANPYQVISGLAQWLAQRNIPAVVAMHFKVKSELANEFARAFYDTLAERTGIEVAMHAARRKLYVGGVMDEAKRGAFGFPVLYLRGSGALLTPLEVAPPPMRTEVGSAAEPIRPVVPDAQRYGDQGYPRPAIPETERWQGTSRTSREDADWRADQELAAEPRERR